MKNPKAKHLAELLANFEELEAKLKNPRERYRALLNELESIGRRHLQGFHGTRLKFDPDTGRLSGGLEFVDKLQHQFLQVGRQNLAVRLSELKEEFLQIASIVGPGNKESELQGKMLDEAVRQAAGSIALKHGEAAQAMLKEVTDLLAPYCRNRKEAAEAADLCSKPRDLFMLERSYQNFGRGTARSLITELEKL